MPKYPQGGLCCSGGGGMQQTLPREAEEFRSVPAAYSEIIAPHQTQTHNRRNAEPSENLGKTSPRW